MAGAAPLRDLVSISFSIRDFPRWVERIPSESDVMTNTTAQTSVAGFTPGSFRAAPDLTS